MKRTSFVCFGAKGNKDALVYQEIPGRDGGEEFFLFFSPAEPAQEPFLRALFREAVSASRLGSPTHYFSRFIDQTRALALDAGLSGDRDALDAVLLLIEIRRGNDVHILCNRDAVLVHWDGRTGTRDSGESLRAFAEIPLTSGKDQRDLFRRAPEDMFSLYRFTLSEGEHTVMLAPSSEFLARHEESLRNSVFFPSFAFPPDAGIEIAVSRSFPALHWKDDTVEAPGASKERSVRAKHRPRVPAVAYALAGAAAVIILLGFLVTRQVEPGPERSAVLLGATDAAGGDDRAPQRFEDPPAVEEGKAGGTERLVIAEAWKKKFEAPVTSSPRHHRGRVYFGCRDGNLYAFTTAGELAWKYRSGSGVGASPCCVEDRIIGADYSGKIFCLDADSGKELWSVSTRSKIVSSPNRIGDAVFAATSDGRIVAVRLADGRTMWETKLGSPIRANLAPGKNYVLAVTTDGVLAKLDRRGTIVWKTKVGAGVASSPACDEKRGIVVCGAADRAVHGFSLANGARVWRYSADSPFNGSVAVSADAFYIGAKNGFLYALSGDGALRWKCNVGGAVNSTPLVAEGVVYVTTYGAALVAVDAATGERAAKYEAESAIYSSPESDGTHIFFGSNGGVFHAVRLEARVGA